MRYGQEIDPALLEAAAGAGVEQAGPRGTVAPDMADAIRAVRAAEAWERYDTINVGPGAAQQSRGWYETFAGMAAADKLTWFVGREPSVGDAYTNQATERSDFAQDLYQFGAEFIAPTGFAEYEGGTEAQFIVDMFTKELPQRLSFRVKIAGVDDVLVLPGTHAPAGMGRTGAFGTDGVAPIFDGGTQGQAHVSNSWKWPDPIMLPAKAQIQVTARIDEPLRTFMQQLTGYPGVKAIPIRTLPALGTAPVTQNLVRNVAYPNWFGIRLFMRGPRYVQLRGARSK